MKTTEDYLKEYMVEFAQNVDELDGSAKIKQDLIDSYNYLAGYIIGHIKGGHVTLKTNEPSTELEYRCLRILKKNGKMRKSKLVLWFQSSKYTKDDVSTALSSLVEKKLIIQDGTFYSVKEQQNEPFNAG